MNNDWTTCKIGDICKKICSGGTPKSNEPSYYGGNIPWLNTKEINFNRIYNTEKYITSSGFDNSSAKWIDANSVIVALYGATAAKVSINTIPLTTNQACCNLTIDETVADYRYVYYYLRRNYQHLALLANGGAQQNLNAQQIKDFNIILPQLPIQHKIANILWTIDDKIELNRRINDNLEEQAKALFKSWFVDFEPFKGGKFVDSELGLIPKGWSTGTIYSYIDVIYGAPYKSALFNDKKQGLPLIRIRDLKTYTPQYYTKEVLPNTEYVECGDIIAGMDAEFIPHIWRGEKGVLNQRLCKFVPKYDYVSKYYIYSLVYPKLAFVQSYKVGTTVSHLGKADIDRFKVIVPPEDIIMQYSKIVNSYFAEIVKVSNENQILSSLRDTLLPKLMSGELSVEEVSLD